MLASVLHSEVAINVSIGIMRAFVEMRRFIANNALLFERISNVELKQLEYQKKTDEKLEQIFEYISDHEESNQKIFFDGQIYDAFSLLIGLIQKAEMEIVLVDGYVDVGTLNILSKKKENVAVTVYTQQRTKLSQTDVDNFNNLWMPVASAYVAPAVYNMLVTIITGGVSMVIFFFVFKIIFPEGKAE